MITDKYWTTPVSIALHGAECSFKINSIREAAWILADKWPRFDGKAFAGALSACAAVLEGRIDADEARLAFLAAAREAELSVAS